MDRKWGIDLDNHKMCYQPWPVDKDGSYKAPDEKEIYEIYGISGEALKEILLYFEECGGDTISLVRMLNEHTVTEMYIITRDNLLDTNRWYTNEYYFYFIMFTKKIIGRYDFHYGEISDYQLSVYHKVYEKGLPAYQPWGPDVDGHQVHDQTLGNISGPLQYLEEEYLISSDTLISFINMLMDEDYMVNREFFNNQLFWVGSEFTDYCYEFMKIISNRNDFFKNAAYYAASNKLRILRIVANVSGKQLNNAIGNAIKKSNEIFIYSFTNTSYGKLEINASIRDSFDARKFSKYMASSLLNRGYINISGFSAIISKVYKLKRGIEDIDYTIDYNKNGFVIVIRWKNYSKFLPGYLFIALIASSLINAALDLFPFSLFCI